MRSIPAYWATRSFWGDSNKTARAYLTTPNGTQYAACTTIQYSTYKPSANSTSIIIMSQTTTGETTLKSPEQMQKDAEHSGGLRPEARFSWGFPWFSLHYILAFEGADALDIGLGLIGVDSVIALDWFWLWLNNFVNSILRSQAIGYILTEIAVWAAMYGGLVTFTIAFIGSILFKWAILGTAWNSIQALQSAFAGAWVSLFLGLVSVATTLLSGLEAVATSFIEAATKANFWKFLYKFLYVPINMIFMYYMLNRMRELGGI
jgi:hypothetical protein